MVTGVWDGVELCGQNLYPLYASNLVGKKDIKQQFPIILTIKKEKNRMLWAHINWAGRGT